MASLASELDLQPDQFAFIFRGDRGVNADDLGNFLRRAATVARHRGAELQVVALQHGSLVVVIKAVAKSAKREFFKAPVATTASGLGIVSAVTAAIIAAMSLANGPTPLAKAGADLVEAKTVQEIQIVTVNQTIVLMDEGQAKALRSLEAKPKRNVKERLTSAASSRAEVIQLVDQGRKGSLFGEVHLAAGELVFRPAGFRYFVPIELAAAVTDDQLKPGHSYQVTADILTNLGQPDRIVIHEAKPI